MRAADSIGTTTRPPYPGLLAFDEADAAIYFGRDDDIRRLIERLNARRAQGGAKLVAVLGASGSGKSSLLRAGVLPRLKRDKRNWIVLPPFRPQASSAGRAGAGRGHCAGPRRRLAALARCLRGGGSHAHAFGSCPRPARRTRRTRRKS